MPTRYCSGPPAFFGVWKPRGLALTFDALPLTKQTFWKLAPDVGRGTR